jgi:transcriptional regulator with XRE-family HTH domain
VTGNQIVAYNLRRAREKRGWKQEEAAKRLEPYLGQLWSKATFSAAERSVDGTRIREFTADELLAFGRVFEMPVVAFFLPPAEPGKAPSSIETGGRRSLKLAELVSLLSPQPILEAMREQTFAEIREALDAIERPGPDLAIALLRDSIDRKENDDG